MTKKLSKIIAAGALLLAMAGIITNCSDKKSGNSDALFLFMNRTAQEDSGGLPFMNGIDENTYLASWSSKTYFTRDGQVIAAADLPYTYFASKGVNTARIRVWVGNAPDGNYANALLNGRAAKQAGLYTLLVIFLSEQWPDNISCDSSKVATIFQGLPFEEKKAAVRDYTGGLIRKFISDGVRFDLYAVDNEVYNCVCGETDKANMAELLNAAHDAIRAEDPKAKFVFHIPHLASADTLAYFNEMIATYNIQCDYLSASFYPLQYGGAAFEDYKAMVHDLHMAYGKPFIISEWSYSDGLLPDNSIWITSNAMRNIALTGYPQSPQGQTDLMRDVLVWAKGSGEVAGVFYWSPLWNEENESGGTLYGWVWLSLFDISGNAKPSLDSLLY